MASPVFDVEQSVFFVGGRGDQSGRIANAGGCTQDWWDTECPNDSDAEKTAAMAKLMTSTGAPIIAMGFDVYTSATDRITGGAGSYDDAEVGMVVYVRDLGPPGVIPGLYKITNVDAIGGGWIECDGINGPAIATVEVNIGGAFDELNNAIDDTSASNYSVEIHTNLNETLSAGVSVAAGGSVLKNTFKRILGFNTVPGDMGRDGAYYESALEILQAGEIDTSKCVTLDADGGAFVVLSLDAGNLIFENLYLKNTNATDAIFFPNTVRNIVLRNCRFSDVTKVMNTEADHVLFDSCYSHDDITSHHYVVRGHNNVLSGCVAKLGSISNLVNFNGRSGVVIGCIAVGGQFGVRVGSAGAAVLVAGNTFYNTNNDGVYLNGGDGVVVVNNIFCLAPGAVGIYVQSGGSVVHNDYNCFIESDGTPLTPTGTEYGGGEAPVKGSHSLEVDPLFVDAANYDFKLQLLSPCLAAGKAQSDGTTQPDIGALLSTPTERVPTAPTITVSISGTTATVTITAEAPATNQVLYHALGASAWTAATPRSGDGDVTIADLVEGTRYVFVAYSILDGLPSAISDPVYDTPAVTGEQTPTGAVGIAVGKLREMFAESATLQDDVGAVGDAAAKKAFTLQYVFSSEYKVETFVYPLVVISRVGGDRQRTGGVPATLPDGSLEVVVNRTIPVGLRASSQNADIEFDNFLSEVIKDVLEKSRAAGYLILDSIDVSEGPYRYEKEELADVAGATLEVRYGMTG